MPKLRFSFAVLLPFLLMGCSEPTEPKVDPPDPPVVETGHPFTYAPPEGAPSITSLAVRGSFNEWGETVMTRRSDGVWRAFVDLPDGTHQYKFFVNRTWVNDMCFDETWGRPDAGYAVDPDADGCTPDGYEGQNAVVTLGSVPLEFAHSQGDPTYVSVAGGRLSVRFRARSGQVESAVVVAGADTVPAHHQLTTGLHDFWRVSLPEATAGYTIEIQTRDSVASFGPFTVPGTIFRSVPWAEAGVAYQIFPERFWNGDPTNDHLGPETDEYHYRHPETGGTLPVLTTEWDGPVLESHCCHQYFGGDLQGIIDRLDHLQALGVTALYLNPIFAAGSVHGYDTFDYLEVAPNFGDSTVLRSLVDAAGARGMRLIWDFVPNHVGIGHWAFRDAVEKGEASAFWDWFDFHVPADSIQAGNGNHYAAWWGFGSLPELETTNPEVIEHLLDVTEHWTRFGFDGIRVDVPNEIENRFTFFSAWRQAAKAIDPEVYLVGEIWGRDASWLRGTQFDALMNYALGEGVVERFAGGEISGVVAARLMAQLYAEYPEAATAMLFNLVASHDTDRLLTKLGGGELGHTPSADALARQRLATALLYAVPGMPVTFQGDECAQLGGRDGRHTARYPVQWDDCDTDMATHYAALAQLKHGLPALRSPAIRAHHASNTLLSFYRGEPGPGEVLVVLNNGTAQLTVDLPEGSWVDAASRTAASGSISVDGLGWRFLEREQES